MSGHRYAKSFKIKVHLSITISSGTNTIVLASVEIYFVFLNLKWSSVVGFANEILLLPIELWQNKGDRP